MEKFVYFVFAVLLVACGEKKAQVEVGSKENFDKGMEIMAERNRGFKETDKLLDDEIKAQEKAKKKPVK